MKTFIRSTLLKNQHHTHIHSTEFFWQ